MVPNGPKWSKMIQNGEKWSKWSEIVKIIYLYELVVYICIFVYCLYRFIISIYLPRLHPWDDPFHTKVASADKTSEDTYWDEYQTTKNSASEVFTLAIEIFQRELQSFGERKSQKLSAYSLPLLRCWKFFLPWSGEGEVFVKHIFGFNLFLWSVSISLMYFL